MENPTAGSAQQIASTTRPIRIWPMVVLAVTGLTCMTVPTLLGMADSFRFMTLAFGAALHLLLLQPIRFGKDQMLIASGEGDGTSLVEIKHTDENWQATKKWSSARLRPDFNDVVVVDSMILGLTKGLLTCVDSANGEMLWKKFRFGSGQLIALPNQNCVLVLSEAGELSLIRVGPKEPTLLHAWQGIQGKTWNHPVLVKNRIYCRSAEEIACYALE